VASHAALDIPVACALDRIDHLVRLDVDVHTLRVVCGHLGADGNDTGGAIPAGQIPVRCDHEVGHVDSARRPLLLAASLAGIKRGQNSVAVELGNDERERDVIRLLTMRLRLAEE
jgi:hypothetical protein